MKRCKDCIHFVACVEFCFGDYDCFDNIEKSEQKHANDKPCVHFKSTDDIAEVRHGTWYHGTENGAVYAKCSACGRKMNYSCYGYAYCSLCGARMDGERKDDE